MHIYVILLHALAATAAFATGAVIVYSLSRGHGTRLFSWYTALMGAMTVLLAAAIIADWGEHGTTERVAFPGLLVLAVFMLYRAHRASRLAGDRPEGWAGSAIEHVGFTLIALFEGFAIVALINAGSPPGLVAVIAALGLLAGRWIIGRARAAASSA